ncbi:putative toxin-antitoxin system toxin component, PIN family [Pedobacter sp. SD-b]|uniref:Toxin-antitoxin system toxin component, PIN family n=1 Tax=Pedobacter segetis TaxID=2793069 RepID=A0ABS1BJ58_9SPHI|nr:putative toxin-antitoxin system toxin component, PIN family [Pedobacter segetis]
MIENYLEVIKVESSISICRDEKDDFILALAKDAKADYIITGDNDLLVLNPFDKTNILTFKDFKQKFKN